jgi:hypothetical protein
LLAACWGETSPDTNASFNAAARLAFPLRENKLGTKSQLDLYPKDGNKLLHSFAFVGHIAAPKTG